MVATRRNSRGKGKKLVKKNTRDGKGVGDSENDDITNNCTKSLDEGNNKRSPDSKDVVTAGKVSSSSLKNGIDNECDVGNSIVKRETNTKAKEESEKHDEQKPEQKHRTKFDRIAAKNFAVLEKAVLDCERELDSLRKEEEAESARIASPKVSSPQTKRTVVATPSTPDRPRRKRSLTSVMKEANEEMALFKQDSPKKRNRKLPPFKLRRVRDNFNFAVEVLAEALSIYRRNVDTDGGATLVFPEKENKESVAREKDGGGNTDLNKDTMETHIPTMVQSNNRLTGVNGHKVHCNTSKGDIAEKSNGHGSINGAVDLRERDDKIDIIERAESLISIWRMSLQKGDKISCPDYHDEFVCDDKKRGWVKLYKARILECIDGALIKGDGIEHVKNKKNKDEIVECDEKGNSSKNNFVVENHREHEENLLNVSLVEEKKLESHENENDVTVGDKESELRTKKKDLPIIMLGDSSIDDSSKYMHQVLPSEKAIRVHYIGYPKAENRWLLLTGQVCGQHGEALAMGNGKNGKAKGSDVLVQPIETHRLSEYALKKEYGLSDSEYERSDEEIEKKEKAKLDSTPEKNTRKRVKILSEVKRSRQLPSISPPSDSRKRRRSVSKATYDSRNAEESDESENDSPINSVKQESTGERKRQLWTDDEDNILTDIILTHIKEVSDDEGSKVDWNSKTIPLSFWEKKSQEILPNRTAIALHKRSRLLLPDILEKEAISKTVAKKSSPKRNRKKNNLAGSQHEQAKKVNATKKQKTLQFPTIPSEADVNCSEHRRAPSLSKNNKHTAPAQSSSPVQQKKNCIGSDSKKSEIAGCNSRATGDSDISLEFTWICTACREAECITDPASPLLVCEGRCFRPFHYPCAGLASIPPSGEAWICGDCKQGKHQCAVCHEYGIDDQDVYCCDNKGCGLFFHEACLSMYDVDINVVEETISTDGDANNTKENSSLPKGEKLSGEKGEEIEQKKDGENNIHHRREDQADGNTQPFERVRSRPKFKCPAHKCWTCASDIPTIDKNDDTAVTKKRRGKKSKGKNKKLPSSLSFCFSSKKEKVIRCLECPNAYHITCIPPSCRFHELALLCHEHASSAKLPDLDVDNSFQKDVEATADKKLEIICLSNKRKLNSLKNKDKKGQRTKTIENADDENKFLRGMKGDVKSMRELNLIQQLNQSPISHPQHHSPYCLPCDFQKEVQSKPPTYSHVHCLRYIPSNRPKRHPPNEVCRCSKSKVDGISSCGEDCLNRMMMVECVGDSDRTNGEKNPYWNCNNGKNCGNRVVGQRQGAKCRPKRERGKGWGLVTLSSLKKGDYVQEYAGEVIDEETMQQRLVTWTRDHPNDPNFYIMSLEPGWYIDAREKGNLARFINHSCDPNCHLVPVNVAGWMRVAIVCTRDISAGEYLSYDYRFDTKHGEKFVCRCGAANCRGTMKGGKGTMVQDSKEGAGPEKKTKKQLLSEAKARLEKDRKFLTDLEESEKERLNQVGILVPGEMKDGTNTVTSGPQLGCKDSAQENRIFLWRNALIGADFSARHWRLIKAKKASDHKGELRSTSAERNPNKVDVLSVIKSSHAGMQGIHA